MAAGGYLITRAGARKMLFATRPLAEGVDHTLFGWRAIGEGAVKALQLVPAIVVQDVVRDDVPQRRDLATTLHDDDRMRAAAQRQKPRGLARWRREARRLADQIRRWIRLAPSMHCRCVPWE